MKPDKLSQIVALEQIFLEEARRNPDEYNIDLIELFNGRLDCRHPLVKDIVFLLYAFSDQSHSQFRDDAREVFAILKRIASKD